MTPRTRIGDAVTLAGTTQLCPYCTEGTSWPGGRYERLEHAEAFEEARGWLLRRVEDRTAPTFEAPWPGPLRDLAWAVETQLGCAAPRAALVHRNLPLGAHRDLRAPYPCSNATVFFRRGMAGGWLVLCEEGVSLDSADGWVAAFDGQKLHGVTDFVPQPRQEQPYRLSVTFYIPIGGDD